MLIDFKNKTLVKLKAMELEKGWKVVQNIIIPDEKILYAFSSMRDKLIFTDKRIVSVNVQGITGSKIDYTSIPYSKIQAFSVETSGTFDLDSELEICISGLGTIKFELDSSTNVKGLCQTISTFIL